jgi:hypothetical protein
MKLKITRSNEVFAGSVRLGRSSCRQGARNIATRALRVVANFRRVETLERKIRAARSRAFGPGDSMANVDRYKAELLARRPRIAGCGLDVPRLARALAA